jgi:ribosome-interacting GTPase 1
MPTNLPPAYYEAEERFKQASSPSEKVDTLEALIATIPKHKGTDKLRADLRKRLSKLKDKATSQKTKKGGHFDLYTVEREGAAQIALVGLPNAGKSSLLASLTHANPVIADYPISTHLPLSGMMPFEDIQIQIVDLPPIGNESTDGWISGLLRMTDGLLIIVDLSDDPESSVDLIIETLESWNIHPSKTHVKAEKQGLGVYKKLLFLGNKLDLPGAKEHYSNLKEHYTGIVTMMACSTKSKENLEELKRKLFALSDIIRVYTKEPGHKPDYSKPFTLKHGSTILDLCKEIHKDFLLKLRFARVWGSARFDGQKVQRDYALQDKDVVEIHM